MSVLFSEFPSSRIRSVSAAQTHLAITSGLGFPVAFLSAPVTTMDPATLIPNPKIPQFISHSRSAIVHLPLPPRIRLLVAAGLWCEYNPSIQSVQKIMNAKGNKQQITAAQAAEIRSGLAYGYCSDSLLREKCCLYGSARSRAEKAPMKNLGILSAGSWRGIWGGLTR